MGIFSRKKVTQLSDARARMAFNEAFEQAKISEARKTAVAKAMKQGERERTRLSSPGFLSRLSQVSLPAARSSARPVARRVSKVRTRRVVVRRRRPGTRRIITVIRQPAPRRIARVIRVSPRRRRRKVRRMISAPPDPFGNFGGF